ncbi:MAG: RDD family protein [Brevinematales bacterium]|nr:RDD family protein [Brevinematales bacterium]
MQDLSQSYQTSEKIRVDFEVAGVFLRYAAFAVDMVLQFLITAGLFIVLAFVLLGGTCAQLENDSFVVPAMIVFLIILAVLVTSYHLIFELLWKGQTPGKKLLHIRVVQDNGGSASALSLVLRNIFRLVDFLPVVYLAGGICALVNKDRKRLGDLVAGTIVVREKASALPDLRKLTVDRGLFKGREDELNRGFTAEERKIIEDYFPSRDFLYETNHFHSIKNIENEMVGWLEEKTGVKCPEGAEKSGYIISINAILSGEGGGDGQPA